MTLTEGEVYLVTARNDWTLIGEYAGRDPDGRLVFVPGPLSPVRIPEADVVDATCLTTKEPVHAR